MNKHWNLSFPQPSPAYIDGKLRWCREDGNLNKWSSYFSRKQTFQKSAGKTRANTSAAPSEVPDDGCHGECCALECRVTNRRLHTTFTGAAETNSPPGCLENVYFLAYFHRYLFISWIRVVSHSNSAGFFSFFSFLWLIPL